MYGLHIVCYGKNIIGQNKKEFWRVGGTVFLFDRLRITHTIGELYADI